MARIEMSRTATSSALQVQERLTHGSLRFTPTQGTQASYASARNRFRSRLVSVFGETESRKSGTPFLSIAMIWAYNAYRFRNQKGKSRLEFPERSMQTTELLVIGAGPYGLCIAAVRGFLDYAGPSNPLAIIVVAVLPSSIPERSRHPVPSAFRSSIARPTDTSLYASSDTSRCRLQDSRPGWIRYSPFL